jgi:hypothetical protein
VDDESGQLLRAQQVDSAAQRGADLTRPGLQ